MISSPLLAFSFFLKQADNSPNFIEKQNQNPPSHQCQVIHPQHAAMTLLMEFTEALLVRGFVTAATHAYTWLSHCPLPK